MSKPLDSSHEFAILVAQLHQSPDNHALKQAVAEDFPKMKALAQANPLDLYRLAQAHFPSSTQYKQIMRQSAAMGCTNAMLAMAELLSKSKTPADLKTAAHYLSLIEHSEDSFMMKRGRTFLESHPEVAALMKAEFKSASYNTTYRFFTHPEQAMRQEMEMPQRKLSCG